MTRRPLKFQLSQGDAAAGSVPKKKEGQCGGARNHHITEFFRPSSKPETDTLLSALSGSARSESMKLQTQNIESWNAKPTTSPRPRKFSAPANLSPTTEPCLTGRRANQTIVRPFEDSCPNCGKSLLSPRVLLERLILPVNAQVYLQDTGGYKIISDDSKAVRVSGRDTGLHSPAIKCRLRSRRKSSLTVLGKVCQTTISGENNCCPLKSLNLLRSDLQTPLDLCQREITPKKHMNPVVILGKTGSYQIGQQVRSFSTPLKRKLLSPNGSDYLGSKNSLTERWKSPNISQTTEDFNHLLIFTSATLERNLHGDATPHSFQNSSGLEDGQTLPVLSHLVLPYNAEPGTPLRRTSHSSDAQVTSPALSNCSPLPDTSEASVKKLKKRTSYRTLRRSSDSDESFAGFPSSSDNDEEEEETFKPLDEIFQMAAKSIPATPRKQNLDLSFVSLSPSSLLGTPVAGKAKLNFQTPSLYVNNLDRLVKEQEESKRLDEMEKLLHEDLEKGLGVSGQEQGASAEDGELTDEHREFLEKFQLVTNVIPDQHPGEEVFHLSESGAIFNLHTLDLKYAELSDGTFEANLIFSCEPENQITLATEGYLTFLYRFKRCPDLLMRWMFQMVSIHPSYAVSVKLLHTLIEITCNNLSNLQEKPWTPSLLDIATVFANMGVHFDTLFPLPHIQPNFSSVDLGPALPLAGLCGIRQSEPIFSHVPDFQIAHVIKFLGFCSAVCRESFHDLEILALIVLLLKLHLEKELKDFPAVDLHSLIETLLQNIKSWETVMQFVFFCKMPEMFYAISELSLHHHNYIKLLQLIPTTEKRGRQLRKHLSLIFMSNILYGNCTEVPLDYASQMNLLCQLMSEMRPSSLVKKMQKYPENMSKTPLDLDQEAYYLTFSLLHLVNDASSSDEPPSVQRKYLQKLCTELEKHIKSDIREGARYFYRTKVKDLVARIHGRWQELLLYSRPNQGKIHDYWEPTCDGSNPNSPQENISNTPQDFPYDD